MKRNWLIYVSIVAALVAGMVCSTAFAEGKKGMQFGGNSFRSSNGSGNSTPKFQQFNGNNNVIRSQNLGGTLGGTGGGLQSQGFPKTIKNPNIGSTIGQGGQGLSGIKVMPREHSPRINTVPGLGQAIGGNGKPPQIHIDPKFGQSIGDAVRNKGKIDPGFGAGKSINDAILGGKIKINPGSGAVKAINDAVLGKHCIPGCDPKPCDPCKKHCNSWCGPTWWWSPCWDPCYKSCYYPCTVYAYPQVIVIPVQTVVAGVPVAPVAEQLMQVPVGATITLQGNNLGDQLGMLVLQIDKISLPAQVNEWKPDAVNVTLPMLGLAGPTKAQLWMVRADGSVAAQVAVELLPAQQQAAGAVGQAAAGQAAPQDAAAAALSAIQ
ncbi:MAG: hypothetical protein L0211_24160 [Planctomycetaceae bacterium]|nr:hypothetical protein [Planctomycetaceae bacterium]